ncbi:tetratricopeptide repeat protein [Treponema pectinovorum]|uniref:tetratricopeptide repeat protein n=1 Tax=Treponema pectinovorum TaxID=164 RepID=UPI0011CB9E2A|nr:tetratricopeptide repeat protein [Treponema pectinovorum]
MPATKENASQLNTQAIEFASKGDFKEAIACFQKALSIERNNYLLWFNLGVTYRDAGDLIRAKEALEKAYEIEEYDDEVIESLAMLNYNLGFTEEALELCEEGILKNEANARLWNTFGVILFNNKNYTRACFSFEKAITINPYYYDALYNLRDTYEELGNTTGYAQCVEQMKSIKTDGMIDA